MYTLQNTPENCDLIRERQSATINRKEFAEWWSGGREALEKRHALEKLFFNDEELHDRIHLSYMSHKELFEHTIAKATKFVRKLHEWQTQQQQPLHEKTTALSQLPDIKTMYEFRLLLAGPLGTGLMQQSHPLRLHFSMFVPTLLGQCTEEQKRLWLNKAWHMDGWIGSYAQTELGHGTFIRGLETRADYDVKREEFILNTPTLTAYKWWPGGLGQTANIAIVMAHLYIEGKSYGLHPFLVRIRSAETHMPEPGVDVGEIGPKIGLNGVNNGYLGLKNVRIPRIQMLMKHAEVRADGSYIKRGERLLIYGTMVYVRVNIVYDVSFGLLQAATISTRYSAVRRQSQIDPKHPEVQILDHLTQQAKIFPQIAKGIFYRLAADSLWRMYSDVLSELEVGNRRNLPELHALSCCLKALCSDEATQGIETLRRACGGHGYLASSNFGHIYGAAAAACTYEGENTVLFLQTARFLLKIYVDGLKRKVLPKTVTYLRNQWKLKWSDELKTLVRALEITAERKICLAFENERKKYKEFDNNGHKATNMSGIKLVQAAKSHGYAFLTRIAFEEVQNICNRVSPALAKVFQQLLDLYISDIFLTNVGDVLRFNAITAKQLATVESRYECALTALRCNAVALVDGFDFHDRVLDSTLGSYDGHVYERIIAVAKQSPLNQEAVNSTFQTCLKPLLQGKL